MIQVQYLRINMKILLINVQPDTDIIQEKKIDIILCPIINANKVHACTRVDSILMDINSSILTKRNPMSSFISQKGNAKHAGFRTQEGKEVCDKMENKLLYTFKSSMKQSRYSAETNHSEAIPIILGLLNVSNHKQKIIFSPFSQIFYFLLLSLNNDSFL